MGIHIKNPNGSNKWVAVESLYVKTPSKTTYIDIPPVPYTTKEYTSAGNYQFEIPPGVTKINITLVGAGGGGGSGGTNDDDGYYKAGGGGGGGAGFVVKQNNLSVTPGDIISFRVGLGGAGGVWKYAHEGSGKNGGAGQATILTLRSTTHTANGGGGGKGGQGGDDDRGHGTGGAGGDGPSTSGDGKNGTAGRDIVTRTQTYQVFGQTYTVNTTTPVPGDGGNGGRSEQTGTDGGQGGNDKSGKAGSKASGGGGGAAQKNGGKGGDGIVVLTYETPGTTVTVIEGGWRPICEVYTKVNNQWKSIINAFDDATCIAVTNEAEFANSKSIIATEWNSFRSKYPVRPFKLLWGVTNPDLSLNIPPAFTTDPRADGPIKVNVDRGDKAKRSDWFALCNLSTASPCSPILLWVDRTGFDGIPTVQASYDYFMIRCKLAGLTVIDITTTVGGENWVKPFNADRF